MLRPPYLDRKRPRESRDTPPLTSPSHSMAASTFLPPVIIKLTDGRVNFRDMRIADRDIFRSALISLTGGREFRDSNIPRGGDLFVYPVDAEQQQALLSINNTAVATRQVACSLPKSASPFHKGVIFDFPTSDSAESILAALKDQGVVDVQRATSNDDNGRVLPMVFLFFESGLPAQVKISSVSYEVKQYVPNPYRCKVCWHLGHTATHCSSAPRCKKCGGSHAVDLVCSTRCVNCDRPDHEADSLFCPAYVDAKNVIRLAVQNNISVREARVRYVSPFNRAGQRQ